MKKAYEHIFPIHCATCGKEVDGNASDLNVRLRAAKSGKLYCSRRCFSERTKPKLAREEVISALDKIPATYEPPPQPSGGEEFDSTL